MIIWFAILIPILAIIFVYIFRRQELVWWEPLMLMGSCIILILVSKLLVDFSSVRTTEYWGSFVTRIEYYEEWDEWIEETCSRQCCCDSKGENCSTEYYDCSYRKYHSPEWVMIDNIGQTLSITQSEYNYIKKKLGGEYFTDLHRDYYHIDGDMYSCDWRRDSLSAVPITTIHHYDNKIKASDYSVFNFQKMDTSDIRRYSLQEYPEVGFANSMHAVIGDNSPDAQLADLKLQYHNAVVGPSREARIFLVIFKDKPPITGDYQKAHWVGANMNEFVVTIGLDSKTRQIQWCVPFSWTTNEKLKIEVRDYISNNKNLRLSQVADYIGKVVKDGFVRRDFKEFDYLTVEPSTGSIIGVFIITLIVTIFMVMWIINNDERSDEFEERISFGKFNKQYFSRLFLKSKSKFEKNL
jgi:hypothetical protein